MAWTLRIWTPRTAAAGSTPYTVSLTSRPPVQRAYSTAYRRYLHRTYGYDPVLTSGSSVEPYGTLVFAAYDEFAHKVASDLGLRLPPPPAPEPASELAAPE